MTSVSTDRRFGVNSGMAVKVPCRAATTANITLSGEQTVDGVALVTGDRCLVKNQTSGVNNGIYLVDTGIWTRTPDFDGTFDVVKGTLVPVTDGTANANSYWRVTTANTITIGTSSIAFSVSTGEVLGTIVSVVNTIAALKALTGAQLGTVMVLGYAAAGDGGGGLFLWNSTDVTADNGGTVIAANAGGTGRWNRFWIGNLNVRWFGAKGDGTTDDTTAIQAALTLGSIQVTAGTYKFSVLTLVDGHFIFLDPAATLKVAASAFTYAFVATGGLSNVGIIGSGESSIIDWSTVGVPINLANFTAATGAILRNFRVTGNSAQTAPQIGANLTNCVRPVCENTVWVDSNVDCIRPAAATDIRIVGNRFKNIGLRSGVFANRCILAGGAVGGVIKGNVANTTGTDVYMIDIGNASKLTVTGNEGLDIFGGVDLESSGATTGHDNTVTGNEFSGKAGVGGVWGGNGIWLNFASFGPRGNVVTGNKCQGFGIGIFGTLPFNNTISGNNCFNNQREGIFVSGGWNNTINGNNCYDNSAGTARRLMCSVMANTFTVGETITGGTSGATGTVIGSDSSIKEVIYAPVTGTFVTAEVITGSTSGRTATTSSAPIKFAGLRFYATNNGFAGGCVNGNTVSGTNHEYSIEGAANSGTTASTHTFDWVSMYGNQCFDKVTSLAGRIKERGTVTNLSLIFTASDTTPAVDHGDAYYTNNSAGTTISDFDSTCFDREITIIAGDANTTLDFTGSNLKGNAGVDRALAAGEIVVARRNRVFANNATVWYCQIITP